MRWEKQWFRQFISIKRFVKRIRSCSIYVDIPPNRFSCPKKTLNVPPCTTGVSRLFFIKFMILCILVWNFIHSHQLIPFNTFKILCAHYLSAALLIYWHYIWFMNQVKCMFWFIRYYLNAYINSYRMLPWLRRWELFINLWIRVLWASV